MLEEHHAVGSLLFMYISTLYRRFKCVQPVESTQVQQPQQPAHSDEKISMQPSISFETYNKFWKRPGYFEMVFLPMKEQNSFEFFKNTHMNVTMFDTLVSMVKEELMQSNVPKEITVEERLALTLT